MLDEVLLYLKNWFCADIKQGEFVITDGSTELPFLADGQYFRIVGSTFNDGLHKYPSPLIDETFKGAVWVLQIPPAVVSLAAEIAGWQADRSPSDMTAESFGGYSYQKATNAKGVPVTWREVFANRLAPYKMFGNYASLGRNYKGDAYIRPFDPNHPWR